MQALSEEVLSSINQIPAVPQTGGDLLTILTQEICQPIDSCTESLHKFVIT